MEVLQDQNVQLPSLLPRQYNQWPCALQQNKTCTPLATSLLFILWQAAHLLAK